MGGWQLLSSLRTEGATGTFVRYERLRSFHAELSDPALAARVEREICLLQPCETRFLRPLTFSWAALMQPSRLANAFMLAANIGLCRPFWLTTCSNCLQRNVQAQFLLPLSMCWACNAPHPNALYPEPELVFAHPHVELGDGRLPTSWDPIGEVVKTHRMSILPGSFGLLPSQSWAYRLVFTQLSRKLPFTRSIAVLPDPKGPERVHVCPEKYGQGGLVIRSEGQLVLRNPFSEALLRAELLPSENAARITPQDVLDSPEYQNLFS